MSVSGKFYITTPIYYVNARPHIGHAYTTIVCDAIARRQRLLGKEVFFLTGTDEHGVHVERAANAAGKTPQKWADEVSAAFRTLWGKLGLKYDKYIRTTDPEHKRGVQAMFSLLQEKGFLYRGTYTGQYCIYDELYVDSAGPGAPCPVCERPTETVSEENYYFKLSALQDQLLQYYEAHPEFILPETRRNEVIAFVKSGLRDLSITRSTFKWGIPVPGDDKHVIYVWLDALCNYITAIGFGSPDKKDQERFEKLWPADVHMIGKEIARFHCVYWPAFLLAAGLPLPASIVAHGWLLFEENKMSKSRGNIVRADTIIDVLGADALRYFLFREIVFGQDGSFSFDALVQRFNADLANDLGNLSSRTLSMIVRYFRGEVPYPSPKAAHEESDDTVAQIATEVIATFATQFDQYQFSRALETVWSLISAVNKYIVENEPWALAEKENEESRARLATVLYTSAEALRIATALAHPMIPDSTARIWSQLGLGDIASLDLTNLKWGQLQLGTKLGKVEAVFPRADKKSIEKMQELEQAFAAKSAEEKAAGERTAAENSTSAPAGSGANSEHAEGQEQGPGKKEPPAPKAAVTKGIESQGDGSSGGSVGEVSKISIDDFAKIDLRVGQIKSAEKVKGADKLLRLEVDLGFEVRQIVAGIALAYAPELLVGRKVVIVANLAPRKLRGLESNGMIVAASAGEDGKPILAGFLEDVPLGARLK